MEVLQSNGSVNIFIYKLTLDVKETGINHSRPIGTLNETAKIG
jgi:hypothetical protein